MLFSCPSMFCVRKVNVVGRVWLKKKFGHHLGFLCSVLSSGCFDQVPRGEDVCWTHRMCVVVVVIAAAAVCCAC